MDIIWWWVLGASIAGAVYLWFFALFRISAQADKDAEKAWRKYQLEKQKQLNEKDVDK